MKLPYPHPRLFTPPPLKASTEELAAGVSSFLPVLSQWTLTLTRALDKNIQLWDNIDVFYAEVTTDAGGLKTVTHGRRDSTGGARTPLAYSVTPKGDPGGRFWVDTVGTATLRVNVTPPADKTFMVIAW